MRTLLLQVNSKFCGTAQKELETLYMVDACVWRRNFSHKQSCRTSRLRVRI